MIREDKIPKHVDTNVRSEYNVITKLIAVRTGGKYYEKRRWILQTEDNRDDKWNG